LLPALGVGCGGGGLGDCGEGDSGAGLGEIDGYGAEDEAEGGDYFKEEEGFEGYAADAFKFAVSGDAGDDSAEDEGGDDHADEAEEDVAEEVGLDGDGGGVDA